MCRKKRIIAFLVAALLLITAAGCGSGKELWEILEEQQYNRYKPRLDHMVEKYGDMFTMNVYGDVYCTDPEYKDWHIGISGDEDDFAIRLRRDDLEEFMMEIAEPIFGRCKVYIHDGHPSSLSADAELEDFFTYNDEWGLIDYTIYVPYSEQYKEQGEALVETLKSRHYTLSNLNILFVEEELYPQTSRARGTFSELPEGYRFRLHSGHYDKWRFEWIENTGVSHMTEKYGDMFKMKLDGTIICTDPEYQDWEIYINNNTNEKYPDTDNFAPRLRRDDLERYMQEIAEPVFGECKVYLTGSRTSMLDVDAETEEFFSYISPIADRWEREPLLSFCICVPYREDYYELADTFGKTLLEGWHYVTIITVRYFDEEAYEQVGRASQVKGYRVAMETRFSEFAYSEYHWSSREDRKKIYWDETEG